MSLFDFLMPQAVAAESVSAVGQGNSGLFFVMLLIIVMMYFMVWRPQSKRAKEQQALIDSLTEGDEVITASGLVGKIKKLDEQFMFLTVAEGVTVRMQKVAVVSALPKGTLKE